MARLLREKITTTCAYCNSPIEKWNYIMKQFSRHYCNLKCKGKWYATHLKAGEHWNWRGGLSNNREYQNKRRKEWRHKKGISKKYMVETKLGIKERRKLWKQTINGKISQKKHNLIHRTRTKDLTVQTIQLVYEDNIKRYGTLTCYLCLTPIPFGKDHLEHKIPLSREGTNDYANLAIACQKCNCKKHTKTEAEFRKEILQYGNLLL